MLDHYRTLVAGTNIDPHSLLSTDYFNSFNTVIMLFGMLPEDPALLDDIDEWRFLNYPEHFRASGLDFAPLAIEAYPHAPTHLRAGFENLIEAMRRTVEDARVELHRKRKAGDTNEFAHIAVSTTAKLQQMAEAGTAIIHGASENLDQSSIDKLF